MKWRAKIIIHRGERRISVSFDIDSELISWIKTFEGSRWSATRRVWHLPDSEENRMIFGLTSLSKTLPNDEGLRSLENFKRWLRSKRYSENTIATYLDAAKSFLVFFNDRALNEITNDDVLVYNNEYILGNNLSASYQNQIVSAIKLFFRTVHDRKIEIDSIHRPKRSRVLPNVLSKEEVKLILESQSNIKHKAMLSLIYSCGLRRSELLQLKPANIDSKRNIITILQAKGKKDRYANLPESILEQLRAYYLEYKPKKYLFEGHYGDQYSIRSAQQVFSNALHWAKINKKTGIHGLRHSFAFHQLLGTWWTLLNIRNVFSY
jgi:integrase/recombinase XerD